MILVVVGDEWMLPSVRCTHEDRAKIVAQGLHNV
jgi:hypothetical protein